jgi:hypothetical protein
MRKLMLFAGAAALAVSMPALAKERERGGGHGRGQAAHANHGGGGHGRAERGRGRSADVRGGNVHRVAHAQRRMNSQERNVELAITRERNLVREARLDSRRSHRRDWDDNRRMNWRGSDVDRRWYGHARFDDHRDWGDWSRRRAILANRYDVSYVPFRPVRGFRYNGCPPGLARHNRYCLPPGQLRKARFIGHRHPIAYWPYNVPARYRYRFVDGNRYFYRYGNDGAIYRFDRRNWLVSSVIPLRSSGLFLGEPLPLGYDVYNVPFAYRPFYRDTSDYLYRYDGNAIYRVNSDSMMIDGIAALLTGGAGGLGGLGIGDPLPVGYDVYNVPFDYRDRYYDTNDWMYRYADGAIYQVDPETRLIQSVISLLV